MLDLETIKPIAMKDYLTWIEVGRQLVLDLKTIKATVIQDNAHNTKSLYEPVHAKRYKLA